MFLEVACVGSDNPIVADQARGIANYVNAGSDDKVRSPTSPSLRSHADSASCALQSPGTGLRNPLIGRLNRVVVSLLRALLEGCGA